MISNRILHHSRIEAMEMAYGKSINEAIEEICQKKDREGLENWRSFYTTYLLPLDKEAQNLIAKKFNMVEDKFHLELFEEYLKIYAQMQYLMEFWVDEKGKLRSKRSYTNADFEVSKNIRLVAKLEELDKQMAGVKTELIDKRKKIEEEMKIMDGRLFGSWLKSKAED